MKLTPRQRRKRKNKNEIINVATALIVQKGLENVSLRDIAKAADYSPAGLYKYFDNKEALIKAVLKRENQGLLADLSAVPADLPAGQLILELCMGYIRYAVQNPAFLILINSAVSSRGSTNQPLPSGSPYAIFLKAVENWITTEAVPVSEDYGLEEITYGLWTLIHGMATLRLNQLKNFQADFDRVNRQTVQTYLKGLRS